MQVEQTADKSEGAESIVRWHEELDSSVVGLTKLYKTQISG